MLKIECLFAFVAENEEGEGVMGVGSPMGLVPLVGADMSRVKSLYPIAIDVSKITGIPFRVVKFTNRQDITEEVKNAYSNEKG